jgi:hypothetical protein
VNAAAALLAAAALCLCACSRLPGPARVRADLPHLGTFEQSGTVDNPATLTTTTGKTALTIPAHTPVTVLADGSFTFTAASPVAVATALDTAHLTGPRSYAPPAPPTPGDKADGTARLWAWVALAAGVAAAAFGAVYHWPGIALGGGCVAAAALVVIALAAVPAWVWTVGIVGLIVAVGGWALWHLHVKKLYPS